MKPPQRGVQVVVVSNWKVAGKSVLAGVRLVQQRLVTQRNDVYCIYMYLREKAWHANKQVLLHYFSCLDTLQIAPNLGFPLKFQMINYLLP